MLKTSRNSLWNHPDFRKLWIGQTISELGSHLTRDGFPLIAVLILSATPGQMGVLAALGSLPPLVLGLFAGVMIDRMRRRPILIGADLGRMLILTLIPLAAFTGHLTIELLGIVLLVHAVLTLFFEIAYDAILPSLVAPEQIAEGNSKLALTSELAEVGGPALTGWLVQLIGAPLSIILDAASFLVSAVSIWQIRTPEPPAPPASSRDHWTTEMIAGWQAIIHNPILRPMVIARGAQTFFGNFYAALYSFYAVRELGFSAGMLGIFISAGGVGGVLGALLAERLPHRIGLRQTLVLSLVIKGGIGLLTPLASGPPWLAAALLIIAQFVGDGFQSVYGIHELTIRQQLVPSQILGRANATAGFIGNLVTPIGALIGGLAGAAIGARGTLGIAAFGMLLISLWLARTLSQQLQRSPLGETS